ncbi:MAG: leucyl aminopeptidase [Acidimicrobiia bacterium]
MSLSVALQSATPAKATAELLAVPVFAPARKGGKPVFGPGCDAVDAALGGGLARFMDEASFTGAAGETLAVPTNGKLGAKAAMLVGLGDASKLTLDGLRRAAATITQKGRNVATIATTLLDATPAALDRIATAQAITEGAVLGSYRFTAYKSDVTPSKLKKVSLLGKASAPVTKAIARGEIIAGAVMWSRDLQNEPSMGKPPAAIVKMTQQLLRTKGVTVNVFNEAQLKRMGCGGIIGVGQGSEQRPYLLQMSYKPRGARATLALVGKGVVFDTGGISIKPADGMDAMKTDMSGAAAVIATMSALKALGVKCNVIGFAPLVENMPSGSAIRPGDVLRHRNGKTSEVLNTDAEGRLILADALSLAVEENVDAIVDIATLTGACVVALGEKIAGVMSNNDGWGATVRAAADAVGESMWPLPLPEEYKKLIESKVADIQNIGSRWGGALTAGLFLQEFVGDTPWVHLDIAGPARAASDDGYVQTGGTGFSVRTLIEVAEQFTKPKR